MKITSFDIFEEIKIATVAKNRHIDRFSATMQISWRRGEPIDIIIIIIIISKGKKKK